VLEHVYQHYHETMSRLPEITHVEWREFAGQRFLYVSSPLPAGSLTKVLLEAGNRVASGTKLKVELLYVRSLDSQHVFRFRFLVPNEKQFCCGNLCQDCFLFRERKPDSR
jgi:hypothetical protein